MKDTGTMMSVSGVIKPSITNYLALSLMIQGHMQSFVINN